MPPLLPEHITEKIKDGSYFSDGLEWYADRYLAPIIHRSVLSIAGILCAITVCICIINIKVMLPLTIILPLPVSIENSVETFYSISGLDTKGDAPQEAVAKFLITHYVSTRESYRAKELQGDELKQKLREIKNTSSKNVFIDYRTSLMRVVANNKQNQGTRSVQIKDISFQEQDRTSGKARITFTSNWSDGTKEGEKNNEWEAILHYRIPDIEILARTPTHIRFFVTFYKLRVIS